jgi:polysaccharide biosynthesis/export protein
MNSKVANNSCRCARFLCYALVLWVSGCATSITPNGSPSGPASSSSPNLASADDTLGRFQEQDSVALDRLWKTRVFDSATSHSTGGFMLDRGDVLRIAIPPLEERSVRVSEEDTVALPLLGEISVAGMTEKDLRTALTARMAKYRHHPQVEVFLQQAEDRQVAVLGAVKTPGRYMLNSRDDTVMTMISRAGGMSEGAASRIFLIPGPPADVHSKAAATSSQVASAMTTVKPSSGGADETEPAPASSTASFTSSEMDTLPGGIDDEQFVIDTSESRGQRYMELPARPGDVILVPLAGEVTVQGWVERAGSFKITPKMTVLNAVAAAGGAKFSSSATLLRETGTGGKQALKLDLSKIKLGEETDPPVEGGDVVVVEKSALGAVPYAAAFIIQHVGLGFPVF